MIKYHLDFARKYLDDAVQLFNQKRYNSSASRAYYASYQAMWSALGEPVDGKIWRHLAIIKHFGNRSRGQQQIPGFSFPAEMRL